jgi:hypothetical protein
MQTPPISGSSPPRRIDNTHAPITAGLGAAASTSLATTLPVQSTAAIPFNALTLEQIISENQDKIYNLHHQLFHTVTVPMPGTIAWEIIKQNSIPTTLSENSYQQAIICQTYIRVWDLLLQPNVLNDSESSYKLMNILVNFSVYINNPRDYITGLFPRGLNLDEEGLVKLAKTNRSKFLEVGLIHFSKSSLKQFLEALGISLSEQEMISLGDDSSNCFSYHFNQQRKPKP